MATDTVTWESLNMAEIGEALAEKRQELHGIFEKHPDMNMSDEVAEDIGKRNLDLQAGMKRYETMRELSGIRDQVQREHSPVPLPSGKATKDDDDEGYGIRGPKNFSIAKAIATNQTYLTNKGAAKPRFAFEIPEVDLTAKTLMTSTAGFPPESTRSGLLVPYALRRPVVADLVPQDNIDQPSVVYMEETTFTNAADTVAEGAAKPESALAYTQRTVPVEVIATWIPVTRQQLDDVAQLQALIENRMRTMLALAEEDQLLNGSGTTPDLTGFYNKAGIQTQAVGADPVPDAIFKAMTKVRGTVAGTGFAEPSGVIMHPNDWMTIRLLRTPDGVYIWGSPADPGVERVWGLPVISTPAATENTLLLGDFQLYSHISRKMGVTLDVSDQHSDYFIANKLAIRIEERLSLEIYRASAFATVTGA